MFRPDDAVRVAMRTKQAPIHSGLGRQTTAREAIGERRLDGRIALVTRAAVGDGPELAERLWSRSEEWTDSPLGA